MPGAQHDSANRDTHTSMRVPGPDELVGGPLGTARAPRPSGAPRPGSARHRADQVRKRRLVLTTAAVALAAAVGVGGWLALSDRSDTQHPPQDTRNSAPVVP